MRIRKIARAILLLGLLGGTALAIWDYFDHVSPDAAYQPTTQDDDPPLDDDRPPIIISGGSIDFEATVGDSERGKFKHEWFGDWFHSHHEKGPKRLSLRFENSDCADNTRFRTTELVLNYKQNGSPGTVKVYAGHVLGFRFLQVSEGDLPAALDNAKDYVLHLGDGQTELVSGEFKDLGNKPVTCTFDPMKGKPLIDVGQRRSPQ